MNTHKNNKQIKRRKKKKDFMLRNDVELYQDWIDVQIFFFQLS